MYITDCYNTIPARSSLVSLDFIQNDLLFILNDRIVYFTSLYVLVKHCLISKQNYTKQWAFSFIISPNNGALI